MRFLRRLTLIALLAALFAWLRKVLSDEIVARSTESQGPTPTEPQGPTPPIGSDSAPNPAPKADVGSNSGEPTKAELYERAQELGIEGRSRMSKAELQRAISQAG